MSIIGHRIPLKDIAARLRDAVISTGATGVTVGTCLDPDYATSFMTTYNRIWVAAQRMRPRDNAEGLTEHPRQNMATEILIQPVVQRYPPASVTTDEVEDRLGVLENVVNQAMFGWRHSLARYAFGYSSLIDGPAYESVCTLNMIFATQLVYQSN